MSARRLPRSTRLAAWVWTGPLGHLHGGVLDWLEVAARLSWTRATRPRRRPSSPPQP